MNDHDYQRIMRVAESNSGLAQVMALVAIEQRLTELTTLLKTFQVEVKL